jgi:hypothetical protein
LIKQAKNNMVCPCDHAKTSKSAASNSDSHHDHQTVKDLGCLDNQRYRGNSYIKRSAVFSYLEVKERCRPQTTYANRSNC